MECRTRDFGQCQLVNPPWTSGTCPIQQRLSKRETLARSYQWPTDANDPLDGCQDDREDGEAAGPVQALCLPLGLTIDQGDGAPSGVILLVWALSDGDVTPVPTIGARVIGAATILSYVLSLGVMTNALSTGEGPGPPTPSDKLTTGVRGLRLVQVVHH
jgi:hypothetical protein